MPFPTFTPPVAPSPGTTIAPEVALNRTPFGDGYTQNSPRGLKPIRRRVDYRWDALTLEQAIEIDAFLTGQQGYQPFYYLVRGEATARKWTCTTWARTDGAPASVTATFEEVFLNAT